MRNQFKKAVTDDVSCRSMDGALQASLLDLFEHAIRTPATTLVRKAKFDTSDFATAKERNGEGFALLVSRARADSRKAWFGAFQRSQQRLDVIGQLE
jgi:hypothetical protein